jgi:hypothetical protein
MLQSIFADSRSKHRPTKKGRSYFKKRQAFPLLKHHCSTTLCSFSIAETPLFNNFFPPLSPIVETPLFNNLSHHFPPSLFNNLSPFSPLLKHHCQQPFTIFPIAETPLSATFHHFPINRNTTSSHHFLPLLKHHCSTVLHISPLTKQHRPTIVSPFFLLLKHHFLSSILQHHSSANISLFFLWLKHQLFSIFCQ